MSARGRGHQRSAAKSHSDRIDAVAARLAGSSYAPTVFTPSPGLEEIVVTARKREETLLSVPQEIQAIGQQEIERANLSTVDDLARFVPSLTYNAIDAWPRCHLLSRRRRRLVVVHCGCLGRDLSR